MLNKVWLILFGYCLFEKCIVFCVNFHWFCDFPKTLLSLELHICAEVTFMFTLLNGALLIEQARTFLSGFVYYRNDILKSSDRDWGYVHNQMIRVSSLLYVLCVQTVKIESNISFSTIVRKRLTDHVKHQKLDNAYLSIVSPLVHTQTFCVVLCAVALCVAIQTKQFQIFGSFFSRV